MQHNVKMSLHSNTRLLFPLSRRGLRRTYRRQGRWGKLPTAACVPQVSCSPSIHSPIHMFLTFSYRLIWLYTQRTESTEPWWEVAFGNLNWSNSRSPALTARCIFIHVTTTSYKLTFWMVVTAMLLHWIFNIKSCQSWFLYSVSLLRGCM